LNRTYPTQCQPVLKFVNTGVGDRYAVLVAMLRFCPTTLLGWPTIDGSPLVRSQMFTLRKTIRAHVPRPPLKRPIRGN